MAGNVRVNHIAVTGRFVGSQDIIFTRPSSRCRLRRKLYFWWRCSDTSQDVGQQAARRLRREEIFLLVPILVYWIYFNFFFNAQIGIRHVLPVFTLATIFCGRFLAASESKLRQICRANSSSLGCYIGSFVPVRHLSRILMNSFLTGNSPIDTLQTPIWIGAETNGIWPVQSAVTLELSLILVNHRQVELSVNALVGVNRSPEPRQMVERAFHSCRSDCLLLFGL